MIFKQHSDRSTPQDATSSTNNEDHSTNTTKETTRNDSPAPSLENRSSSSLTYEERVQLAQQQHTTTDAVTPPVPTADEPHQPKGTIVLELDKVMVDRHMSLKELADEVGISNVNLSKIKNNRVAAIRFTTLAGICEALECQPGDILKYESKQPA